MNCIGRFVWQALVFGLFVAEIPTLSAQAVESWVIVQRGYGEPATKVRVSVVRIEGDQLVLMDIAGRTTRRAAADLRGIVEVPPGLERSVDHAQALAMLASAEKALELLPADLELKQALAAWQLEVGQLTRGMRKEGGRWVDGEAQSEGEYRAALAKLRDPPHVLAQAYSRESVDAKVREGESLLSRFPQKGVEIRAAMGAWLGEQLQMGRGLTKVNGQWITAVQLALDQTDAAVVQADRAVTGFSRDRVVRAVGSRSGAVRWLALPVAGLLLLAATLIVASAPAREARVWIERVCLGLAWSACIAVASGIVLAASRPPLAEAAAAPDVAKTAAIQAELQRAFRGDPPGMDELEIREADLNACLAPWFGGGTGPDAGANAWAWARGVTVHIGPGLLETRRTLSWLGFNWQLTHRHTLATDETGWELRREGVRIGRLPLGGVAAKNVQSGFEAQIGALLRDLKLFDYWGLSSIEPGRLVLTRLSHRAVGHAHGVTTEVGVGRDGVAP